MVRKDITILRCSDLEGDNNAATGHQKTEPFFHLDDPGTAPRLEKSNPSTQERSTRTSSLSLSLSLYGVKLEEKGELAADQTREEGVMPGVRSYGSKLHDPLVRIQEHKTILILE
jgi:hypothetical protein